MKNGTIARWNLVIHAMIIALTAFRSLYATWNKKRGGGGVEWIKIYHIQPKEIYNL